MQGRSPGFGSSAFFSVFPVFRVTFIEKRFTITVAGPLGNCTRFPVTSCFTQEHLAAFILISSYHRSGKNVHDNEYCPPLDFRIKMKKDPDPPNGPEPLCILYNKLLFLPATLTLPAFTFSSSSNLTCLPASVNAAALNTFLPELSLKTPHGHQPG